MKAVRNGSLIENIFLLIRMITIEIQEIIKLAIKNRILKKDQNMNKNRVLIKIIEQIFILFSALILICF
jgi:hypothetical protein